MTEIFDTDTYRETVRRIGAAREAQLEHLGTINEELTAALREIEAGLRNTGTDKWKWMTRITKPQAWKIANAALAKIGRTA